ncbi:MAG: hypothetical protein AAF960_23880 [Bacteroidota bacterium]
MNNTLLTIFLSIFSLSLLYGQGVLRGSIVQQSDGVAISGASVYILGIDETKTDSNGSFALDLSDCTDCTANKQLFIKVNSDYGFTEEIRSVAAANYPITIKVPRNNKLIISGRVKDKQTGAFLQGIQVKPILGSTQVTPQETNAFGEFEFVFNKRNIGHGGRQAVNLAFRDADAGKYRDLEGWFPTGLPLSIELEECADCGTNYELKVGGNRKSGIKIERGDEVIIKASGSIKLGVWVGNSGPEGLKAGVGGISLAAYNYNELQHWNHAVLCFRFSSNEPWKYYDPQKVNAYYAQSDGYLEFLINDKKQWDNTGAYEVQVTIRR